ncbi:hypothetical protein Si123_01896 [Streptococcus infantarius subsp. infantarius]|nr:hypothetical protein [Streptococcus infantarius subsp. infantarius]
MKVKVYKFTDNSTQKAFTGTIEEYCLKTGLARQTLDSRVKKGNITRKEVGVKDNGRSYVPYEFSDKVTSKRFVGYYAECCREWNLTYYQLRQRTKLGVIDVKKVSNVSKKIYYTAADSNKMTPLEREVSRKYWLERAQKLERES